MTYAQALRLGVKALVEKRHRLAPENGMWRMGFRDPSIDKSHRQWVILTQAIEQLEKECGR